MRNLLICVGALLLVGLSRVIPHEANVTPFLGVALAVGFLMNTHLRLAVLATVGTMALSDVVVGFHWTAPFVYAGLAFATWAGARSKSFIQQSGLVASVPASAAVSGFSSLIFFVVSNLGVWFVGGLYPLSVSGLIECFTMAIPFFWPSLASDLLFGTVLLTAAARFAAGQTVSSNVSVANG